MRISPFWKKGMAALSCLVCCANTPGAAAIAAAAAPVVNRVRLVESTMSLPTLATYFNGSSAWTGEQKARPDPVVFWRRGRPGGDGRYAGGEPGGDLATELAEAQER